ncbi:hypothetical protein [Spectribacter hydrogenoxidans]|uniref:GGDEF domain-containing protein n=1 Tax=Spectribacter hydrogenoxidans TaxID=3075608 RepID=A0ABU3C3A9_9GAMM|nr:hypothetical protein [Salinisphaera sp. W335]MDT0636047.1 hypothetical protein [Salinisphaera sp. W335]
MQPLAAAAALLWVVLAPVLLFNTLDTQVDRLADRLHDAARAELAPRLRQDRVPADLVAAAEALLTQPRYAVNYLTLRNADGVVLTSVGSLESVGNFLQAAQARQLRGLLYRASSSDRRFDLSRDGERIGFVDAGIAWRGALMASLAVVASLFVSWLIALVLAWRWLPALIAAWRERGDQTPITRPAPGSTPPSAPSAAPARTRDADSDAIARYLDRAGIGWVALDHQHRIARVNQAMQSLLHRDASALKATRHDQTLIFLDGENQRTDGPLARALSSQAESVMETTAVLQCKGHPPAAVSVRAVPEPAGSPHALTATFEPREPASPAATDDLAGLLIESAPGVLAIVDSAGRIRRAGTGWHGLFGQDAVPGGVITTILPEEPADLIGRTVPLHLASGPAAAIVSRLSADDYLVSVAPVDAAQPDSPPANASGTVALLAAMQAHADEPAAQGGLLIVADVVDCGRLNRMHGRVAVDQMLDHLVDRWRRQLDGATACITRIGGDEIALFQTPDTPPAEALPETCRRLEAALRQSPAPASAPWPVLRWGGAASSDGMPPERVLNCALIAVQAARMGDDDRQPMLYAPHFDQLVDEQSDEAAHRLAAAMTGDELDLQFWPVLDEQGGVVAAVVHVTGPVADDDAPALAREQGMAAALDAWTLGRVGRVAGNWRDIGLPPVPLLWAPAQDTGEALDGCWRHESGVHRLSPDALMVVGVPSTILPRAVMDGDDEAPSAQLRLVPEALLAGLAADQAAVAGVKAIVSRARRQQQPLVAGPVADEETAGLLVALGCGLRFGPAVAAPLLARAFGRFLARRKINPLVP